MNFNSFDDAVKEALKRLEKSLDVYNENVLQNNRLLEQLIQLQVESAASTNTTASTDASTTASTNASTNASAVDATMADLNSQG